MTSTVRSLHNAVARQGDVAASTRPPRTTRRDLERMVRDVDRKLGMKGRPSVCELGAGTGVLAVPLARRSNRFVGVDFAEEAVAVLRERFEAADLNTVAQGVVMDVLGAPEDELIALGQFDRVLVYASLHYVQSPDQADLFMGRALSLLAPGGRALFGNLPVEGQALRSNPWWAGRAFACRLWRWLSRRGGGPSAGPSIGGPSVLQAHRLQAAVEGYGAQWRWLRPAVGTPMFVHRLDLVVTRPPAKATLGSSSEHLARRISDKITNGGNSSQGPRRCDHRGSVS